MAGDITRNTFDPVKHYSAVRQQQGRVSVDADWNEQADIAVHRVQTGTADVLGRTGAPRDNAGFQLVPLPLTGSSSDLALSPGRMYVDGILCEIEASLVPVVKITGTAQIQLTNMVVDGRELAANQWVEVSATDSSAPNPVQVTIQSVNLAGQTLTVAGNVGGFVGMAGVQLRRITTYLTQPDSPSPAAPPPTGLALAYLDVWERNITAIEDGEIRDPALGPATGPDTTTRSKTIWQVKLSPSVPANTTCSTAPSFASFIPQSTGQMAARSQPTAAFTSACIIPPRAGYRRLENQLYRVEVHTGGSLPSGKPTFKWSRDNGSVTAAIVTPAPVLTGNSLTLNVSSLGRDQVLGFATGQFVELTEDGRELAGQPGILVQLTGAAQGPQGPVLTADTTVANSAALSNFLNGFTNNTVRNPKVRRWDQSGSQVSTTAPGGDIPIQEGTPIDLEGGVQVIFEPGGEYLSGDYWLVPARTVTGDVDWPRDSSGNPQFRSAQGIRHHYAQLGIIDFSAPAWAALSDCRQLFAPLADTGIHITQVFLSNPTPTAQLQNDAPVLAQDLQGGITIVCDLPIDPVSLFNAKPSFPAFPLFPLAQLGKPTCFVTVNVPTAAAGGLAIQPMIVPATLALDAAGTSILWAPTNNALLQIFAQTPTPGPLLAHLTLRGNYIWALGNPSLFLDGETFGGPDPSGNQRTGLSLPSGDGRRGGDFEMWFWLTSPPTGVVVVSPASLDFGNQPVNASATLPVTVINNTAAQVNLAVTVSAGDFTATPPSATLAAGASATVNVTFKPTQAGLRTATITITPPGAPAGQVQLTGTALGATLQPSPAGLSFPVTFLGDSTNLTLTLTNLGSVSLTINSVAFAAATNDFGFSPNVGGAVLAPGGSVSMTVTFRPSQTGQRTANITVTHTGTNSPLVIALSGTGRPPIVKTGGGGVVFTIPGAHPSILSQ